SSREKKQSVMTALAMLMEMDTALGACAGSRGAVFSKFRQLLSPAFGVRYKEIGDVVPVRVRTKKTIDDEVREHYSDEDFTLLPVFFTWDQLYTEMQNYVKENELDVREP
ncbi:hypothetical protein PC110_g23802, partial [Phytophthora cactorum]